jgi:hypothetical protein
MTPAVLRHGPYRLYFHSHEPNEPPHVHVDRDDQSAKFWLREVALAGISDLEPESCVGLKRSSRKTANASWRPGMSTSAVNAGERVKDVRLSEDTLSVDLADGRTITVPLAWYPRLLHATPEQRKNWQLAGAGFGIHWPDVDEDLSTEGLLRGAPAPGGFVRLAS